MEIDAPANKELLAIVVVGYNRLSSLKRVLRSTEEAYYPTENVPLIISVDCSGDVELYDFVKAFKWSHGEKYVFIQEMKLGLKDHILKCGDITKYFKGVILLEDDLFVSPYYYYYVLSAVEKYYDDSHIAQIALYKNELNGYVGLPAFYMHNGYDAFLGQWPCSWGQCWTDKMWRGFREWYNNNKDLTFSELDIPADVKNWTKAWSKFFMAYMIENNKFALYPYESVSTNFNDAGVHNVEGGQYVQVNLLMGKRSYCFCETERMISYDVYLNNRDVFKWINLDEKALCLDLYGINDNINNRRYLLSVRKLPYKIVRSYGVVMRPIELNIFYSIEGEGIYLYDTEAPIRGNRDGSFSSYLASYYFGGFNYKLLSMESYIKVKSKIINRLKLLTK